MKSLNIRTRAVEHSLSMEEEVRRIITHKVLAPKRLANVFQKYFGKKNGVDLDISNHRVPQDPINLTGRKNTIRSSQCSQIKIHCQHEP